MTLKEELDSRHRELVLQFCHICKAKPRTIPAEIPGATEALKAIDEFEDLVEKFFGYRYDSDKTEFIKKD